MSGEGEAPAAEPITIRVRDQVSQSTVSRSAVNCPSTTKMPKSSVSIPLALIDGSTERSGQ